MVGIFRRRTADEPLAVAQRLERARPRTVILSTLYGTGWQPVEGNGTLPPSENLGFGRLERYYDDAQLLLPSATVRPWAGDEVAFTDGTTGIDVVWARLWLFRTASGQSVPALSLGLNAAGADDKGKPADDAYRTLLTQIIDLLNTCRDLQVTLGDVPLGERIEQLARETGVEDPGAVSRERHQLVIGHALPDGLVDNDRRILIEQLVYRTHQRFRDTPETFAYPEELNKRPGATVVVGPYVSLLFGTDDEEDNAAFVSAAQLVASAARLRYIREAAHRNLETFRDAQRHPPGGRLGNVAKRRILGQAADTLGDLELELSFSVEAAADISLIVPAWRVTAYHDALFVQMGLKRKFRIVSRMLRRLARSIQAETLSLDALDRHSEGERRRRWEAAYFYLATIPLAAALALGFLGMNASEVVPVESMWAPRYYTMYTLVTVVVLGGILVPGVVALWQLVSRRLVDRRQPVEPVTMRTR